MTKTVQVDGADRCAATLRAAGASLGRTGPPARVAAEGIGRQARARAPRRTGRLASSITVASEADGATVGTSLRYAPYVNFGTRYVAARPFLTAAAERGEPLALAAYEKSVNQALSRVKGV